MAAARIFLRSASFDAASGLLSRGRILGCRILGWFFRRCAVFSRRGLALVSSNVFGWAILGAPSLAGADLSGSL